MLVALAAWLDAHLHDALTNGGAITKTCDMPNIIIHCSLASLAIVCMSDLDRSAQSDGHVYRVGDVGLVDGLVYLTALTPDVLQVGMHIAADDLVDLVVVE